MARYRRDVWFYIAAAIFAAYLLFLLYPLVNLLVKSVQNEATGEFTLANFQKFFSRKYYYGSIVNSLKVTAAVTTLAVLVATPLAYVMTTVKIRFSQTIQILILISTVSPPFIGAYSWILLLGRNGAITNLSKKYWGSPRLTYTALPESCWC